ncbi:MAG: NfeD family protein [Halobacterium sp.]
MVELFGLSLALVLVLVGTGLTVAEALIPGSQVIVIGTALLSAGLFGLFFPSLATPLVFAIIVFGVGAVTLVAYRYLDVYEGSGRGASLDAADLRGERGYALEEVTPRSGRVELDSGGFDPSYSARTASGAIAEGERVVVVDEGGGNVLTVEPVEESSGGEARSGGAAGGEAGAEESDGGR